MCHTFKNARTLLCDVDCSPSHLNSDFIVVNSFRDTKFGFIHRASRGDRISRPLRCRLPHSVRVIHKKSKRGRRPNQRIKQKIREWQDGDHKNWTIHENLWVPNLRVAHRQLLSFMIHWRALVASPSIQRFFIQSSSFLLPTTKRLGGAPVVWPLMHSHSLSKSNRA